MKDARSNTTLAALAALALAAAPAARADVRVHVSFPLPPPPHRVIRALPAPPLPPFLVHDARGGHHGYHGEGRWSHENRHRDDRYRDAGRYRDPERWAFVEGRWVVRPFRGAVWVEGYPDRWGRWIPGYWTRARCR